MVKEFFLASSNGLKAKCLEEVIDWPVKKIHVAVDERTDGLEKNYLLPLVIAQRKVEAALKDPQILCEKGATIVGTDTLGFVATNNGLRVLGKPKNWSEALEFSKLISEFGVVNVAGTVITEVGSNRCIAGGVIIETPSLRGFEMGNWLYYSDRTPERVLEVATGIDFFYASSLFGKPEILVDFLSSDGKRERLIEYRDFDLEDPPLELRHLIHGFSNMVLEKLAEKL